MAITDSESLLIVGAGVSAPFGIPLGGELIDLIANSIDREERALFGNPNSMTLAKRGMTRAVEFWDYPTYSAIAAQTAKEGRFDPHAFQDEAVRLRQLKELLRDQTSETIDDFIVENGEFSDITKIAVAAQIIVRCYSLNKATSEFEPCPFQARTFKPRTHTQSVSPERNWVHLLINIVRHGVRQGRVSKQNKIQIVSFNYDPILEWVLDCQFSNSASRYADWRDYIEIIHVHGHFDPIVAKPASLADVVCSWASKIHVVNETETPEPINISRARAKRMIEEAREIYVAGFAFAGLNCRLLGLTQPWARANKELTISYCNYDGNVGIQKTVKKLERDTYPVVRVEETAGSIERPLSIVNWLKAGHLGELPG